MQGQVIAKPAAIKMMFSVTLFFRLALVPENQM